MTVSNIINGIDDITSNAAKVYNTQQTTAKLTQNTSCSVFLCCSSVSSSLVGCFMFKTDFRDTQRQFRDNKSKAWSESSLATKTESVLYVKQNEKRKLKRDLLNFVSEMDTTHHEL